MLHEEEVLSEFKNEMWLYIEGSLPPARMEYWSNMLSKYPEVRSMYEDTQDFLNSYNSTQNISLEESKFENIITNVTSQKQNSKFGNIFETIKNDFKSINIEFGKIVFASGLVIASIIILLFLNKPIVNTPNSKVLDWEGSEISNSLSQIDHSVYQLKNTATVDYMIYNYTKDKWNNARTILEDQIKTIKNEINNKSF